MTSRRAFVAGVVTVLAAPLAAEAQQAGKVYRMGMLYGQSYDNDDLFNPEKYPADRALAQGLREHGYVVGQNLILEMGPVKGKHAGPGAFASELVRLKVDLIYVYTCGSHFM